MFYILGQVVMADEYHFVAFRFKSDVSDRDRSQVMERFLALKTECLRDGNPFILELSAGVQNSPETPFVGQEYEQGFVTKFKDASDRDFYVGCLDAPCQKGGHEPAVGHCVAHDNFKVFVGPLLEDSVSPGGPARYNSGVLVFDYTGSAHGDLSSQVVHMVHFRFKADIDDRQQEEVMRQFLALKDECITDKPIVQALTAGNSNSLEGTDQMYSQGYFVLFGNERDRDFYVGCADKPCQAGGTLPDGLSSYCEAHDDFKVFVGDFLDVDEPAPEANSVAHYNPGVFVFDYNSVRVAAELI